MICFDSGSNTVRVVCLSHSNVYSDSHLMLCTHVSGYEGGMPMNNRIQNVPIKVSVVLKCKKSY